jgi:hypothetical protein
MYKRRRNLRAWAAIPAIVLLVAISVIAGPTASVLAAAAVTANPPTTINGNLGWGTAYSSPAGTLNGISPGPLANWLPARVTVPRLPSTSTSNDDEPLKPVNFVQGFALGFALVLIVWLLLLGSRKSA